MANPPNTSSLSSSSWTLLLHPALCEGIVDIVMQRRAGGSGAKPHRTAAADLSPSPLSSTQPASASPSIYNSYIYLGNFSHFLHPSLALHRFLSAPLPLLPSHLLINFSFLPFNCLQPPAEALHSPHLISPLVHSQSHPLLLQDFLQYCPLPDFDPPLPRLSHSRDDLWSV